MREAEKKVLGVKIDDVSMEEAAEKVTTWLKKNHSLEKNDSLSEPKIIVTPGPEFLVTAQSDREFKEILNAADLAIPDGFGLHLAGVKNRIPGVEFMLRLCELSAKNGWSIGLLGGQTNVAHQTASKLRLIYPNINIDIIIDGREADEILRDYRLPTTVRDSSRWTVDILFVAFGHPKQEKFLWKLKKWTLKKNDSLQESFLIKFRVGMGVGGAFDYISGRVLPAPKVVGKLGVEWLWRAITQLGRPRHIRRILVATIVFPLLLFNCLPRRLQKVRED